AQLNTLIPPKWEWVERTQHHARKIVIKTDVDGWIIGVAGAILVHKIDKFFFSDTRRNYAAPIIPCKRAKFVLLNCARARTYASHFKKDEIIAGKPANLHHACQHNDQQRRDQSHLHKALPTLFLAVHSRGAVQYLKNLFYKLAHHTPPKWDQIVGFRQSDHTIQGCELFVQQL